ncbi:MAG: thioredoxin family protein [Chloroflexi bacterium]|nr:thioredoxin family protein [Chloroflexota bacterium]
MGLNIKVLGYRKPARYAVRHAATAAWNAVKAGHPGVTAEITEVAAADEICKYTSILILPSLVINDKLVCAGRVPSREEIGAWIEEALAAA